MGKAKRKAEKAAKAVLGVGAAKELKARKKKKENQATETNVTKRIPSALPRSEPPWRNKEKPLILCARGITYRFRHLMTDIMQLIPHHKTDSKLDTKHDWNVINEVAELKVWLLHTSAAHRLLLQMAPVMNDLYLLLLSAINDETFPPRSLRRHPYHASQVHTPAVALCKT